MRHKRIAIVGSRDYANPQAVRDYVNSLPDGTTIISGGARGVDSIAISAANEYRLPTVIYFPEWGKYGNRAGMIRNQHIVDAADEVVAFWDGESKGTADTIAKARKAGKPVTIILQAEEAGE